MDKFDWNAGATGGVCVEPQNGIAVYSNEDGDTVIRVQGWPNEDEFVVIPFSLTKAVASAMLDVIGEP